MSAGPADASEGPLQVGDRAAIAELGEALRAAGFTGEGLRQVLGVSRELLARSADIAVHTRRLSGVGPIGPLVKLFVLELAISLAEAAEAFGSLPLERVRQLGVVKGWFGIRP